MKTPRFTITMPSDARKTFDEVNHAAFTDESLFRYRGRSKALAPYLRMSKYRGVGPETVMQVFGSDLASVVRMACGITGRPWHKHRVSASGGIMPRECLKADWSQDSWIADNCVGDRILIVQSSGGASKTFYYFDDEVDAFAFEIAFKGTP